MNADLSLPEPRGYFGLERCLSILVNGAQAAYTSNSDFVVPAADVATLRDILKRLYNDAAGHDPAMDAGYVERLESALRGLAAELGELREMVSGTNGVMLDSELHDVLLKIDGMAASVTPYTLN